MRFVIIFVVLMCGVGPGRAQVTDPYASDVQAIKIDRFKAFRDQSLKEVENIYFALSCAVFASEGDINPLRQSIMGPVYSEMVQDRLIDPKLDDKIRVAASTGMERGKNEGCEYWHTHIDEVASLRRSAANAMRF